MDHIFLLLFCCGDRHHTSVLVVALRNPGYSALALLIMFFHMSRVRDPPRGVPGRGPDRRLCRRHSGALPVCRHAPEHQVEERYHNQLPVAGLLGVMLCTEIILLLIQSRTAASAQAVPPDPVTGSGQYGNGRGSLVLNLFVSL